jgi:hypothetical protein
MLNQRESDLAHLEAEVEVRELLEEWYRDYLGSRGKENALPDAGNAGLQAPSGPGQENSNPASQKL